MNGTEKTFLSDEKSLERLCIHTATTKPWPIERAIEEYSKRGIGGISIWRDAIEGKNLQQLKTKLSESHLNVVSLVRGGFFPSTTKEGRFQAQEINKSAILEAEAIGAPQLVLVCGADPALTIQDNIQCIQEGIEELLVFAKAHHVKLSIEPLHPMYADTRSAITTLKLANDICEKVNDVDLGVAIDVFHVWWDPELNEQMKRTAELKKFFALHFCDWKTNMSDMLNDRGLMGEGVIHLKDIRKKSEELGFDGYHEVEIFSNNWWAQDQSDYLDKIIKSYKEHC